MDGRGIDRRGDVHEAQVRDAAGQPEFPHVPHERDIRVVHGDGQLHLIVDRRLAVILGRRRGGLGGGGGAGRNGTGHGGNPGRDYGRDEQESSGHQTAPFVGCPLNGPARISCSEGHGSG